MIKDSFGRGFCDIGNFVSYIKPSGGCALARKEDVACGNRARRESFAKTKLFLNSTFRRWCFGGICGTFDMQGQGG